MTAIEAHTVTSRGPGRLTYIAAWLAAVVPANLLMAYALTNGWFGSQVWLFSLVALALGVANVLLVYRALPALDLSLVIPWIWVSVIFNLLLFLALLAWVGAQAKIGLPSHLVMLGVLGPLAGGAIIHKTFARWGRMQFGIAQQATVMMAPAVILLLIWMVVPLSMTLYFSFKKYLPLRGGDLGWVGFDNYTRFVTSSSFWPSIQATLLIVGGVLVITVVLGVLLALLLDQPMWGQGVVRILVIAPFFVMPTVSALVWKNMFMDPVNGVLAHLWKAFGLQPVEWLTQASLPSIIMIVSWQWLPFATLILLTAIQSLDSEQLEAAEMDGAPVLKRFWFIILPHLARAMTVVLLIQTIFLLSIFAEIFVTTQGSGGTRTLTYLIFQRVLDSQNVGLGSAGGVYAIILANIVAIFLMRIVGKNLDA